MSNNRRSASLIRRALRAIMSQSRMLLPRQPTLWRVRVGPFRVFCWINDAIGRRLFLARSYEATDVRALEALVRPGDVIADIGANIGYLSMHLARLTGPTGHVHAFEPLAHLHPVVALNATMNGLPTISVHPLVVTGDSGARAAAAIPDNEAACAYFKPSSDGVGVTTTRLDDFADQCGIVRFDVVKIDVEGGEVGVLRGADRLISDPARRPRVFMIEVANAQLARFGHRLEDIHNALTEFGYRASIHRNGRFDPVANPSAADCWNVFFIAPDARR